MNVRLSRLFVGDERHERSDVAGRLNKARMEAERNISSVFLQFAACSETGGRRGNQPRQPAGCQGRRQLITILIKWTD